MSTKSFVEVLKDASNLHTLQGVSEDIIHEAQERLGILFSPEYVEYLKAYGVASANGHEFTGLGSSKRLSVIDNTLQERELHPGLLDKYYVVEQCNIDGIIVVQASDSSVYMLEPHENLRLVSSNLGEYLLL